MEWRGPKLATEALIRFLLSKGVVNESEQDEFIAAVAAEDGSASPSIRRTVD